MTGDFLTGAFSLMVYLVILALWGPDCFEFVMWHLEMVMQ